MNVKSYNLDTILEVVHRKCLELKKYTFSYSEEPMPVNGDSIIRMRNALNVLEHKAVLYNATADACQVLADIYELKNNDEICTNYTSEELAEDLLKRIALKDVEAKKHFDQYHIFWDFDPYIYILVRLLYEREEYEMLGKMKEYTVGLIEVEERV